MKSPFNTNVIILNLLLIFAINEIAQSQNYGNIINARRGDLTNGRVFTTISNNNLSFGGKYRLSWPIGTNGYMGDLSFMFGGLIPIDTLVADKSDSRIKNFRATYGRYVFPSMIISDITGRPNLNREEAPNGDVWSLQPVAGYFNPNQANPATSNNPNSWPSSWSSFPYAFGSVFPYSTEVFYVMDDHPDYEFNQSPFNYKTSSTDPIRKGTGIEVQTSVVLPNGSDYNFAKDLVFLRNKVKNISDHNFDVFNMNFLFGSLIGVTGTNSYNEWDDDVIEFDPVTSTIYSYDFDSDVSRNPRWVGKSVGYIGMRMIKGPQNNINGIDDDRNEHIAGKEFSASDFLPHTVQIGDVLVSIKDDYSRTLRTVTTNNPFKIITKGMLDSVLITPGVTSLAEGSYQSGSINTNAFDGIDNDFDGLIDENYLLHYNMRNTAGKYSKLVPTRFYDYTAGGDKGLIDNNDLNHFYSMNFFSPSNQIDFANDQNLFIQSRTFNLPNIFNNNIPVTGEDGDALVATVPVDFPSGETHEYEYVIGFGETYEQMMGNLDIGFDLWKNAFVIPSEKYFSINVQDTLQNDINQTVSWTLPDGDFTDKKGKIVAVIGQSDPVFLKEIMLTDLTTSLDLSIFPAVSLLLRIEPQDSELDRVFAPVVLRDKTEKPSIGYHEIYNAKFQVNVNPELVNISKNFQFKVKQFRIPNTVKYSGLQISLTNTTDNQIINDSLMIFGNTTEMLNGLSLTFSDLQSSDIFDDSKSKLFSNNTFTYMIVTGGDVIASGKTLRSDSLFNVLIRPGIDTSFNFSSYISTLSAKKTNFIVLDSNHKQIDFLYYDFGTKGILDKGDELRLLYEGNSVVQDDQILIGIPGTKLHFGNRIFFYSTDANPSKIDSADIYIKYGLLNPVTIDINGATILDVSNENPTSFSIGNAYPNPFNPSTNIQIKTGNKADIYHFKVFDLLGRLVFDQGVPINSNSIFNWRWNPTASGTSVSSGIYLIQVSNSNSTQIRKAVLMK